MPRTSIEDPLKDSNFFVEVDGFVRAGFTKVSGLSRKTDVISYREGGDNAHPRLSAGMTSYDPIVMSHGVTAAENDGSFDFIDWITDVHNAQARNQQAMDYRRDFDIVIPNRDGSTGARFRVIQGWPSEWKLSDLDASSNGTLIEEMTIVHEGFERVT